MNPKIENSIKMSDYVLEEFEKCKEDLQYFYNTYIRHSEKCRIFNFPKSEISKKNFIKFCMKNLIDKVIIFFSYKHPHLWLEINEMIFDEIEDYKKKQKEKMHKNVQKLIKKLK